MSRWLAWAGFVFLLALHLDFWRPLGTTLYFGWLPEELGYRLLWIFLTWLYLLCFTAWLWPEEDP